MPYIPFGEYKPDLRYLINDGLLVADNVIPVYSSYIASPALDASTPVGPVSGNPQGLLAHADNGNVYIPISNGVNTRVYQVTPAGAVSDVSRGALYAAPLPPFGGWTGCSFGQAAVLCPEFDEVQYQPGGAGAFSNLITSTFAPKARFCFPLRQNLFLARCTLPAPYDGLAAGANPTLVAWSQDDNIRAFGSPNADPQLIGAGYQALNYDIGDMRAALAGADYGIFGFSNGIVRVDGPPYTFRVISRQIGLAFPYGACAAGDDIYFMSPSGLARLRGGEGPPEILGVGRFLRSLIDNSTGFSRHPASLPVGTALNYEPFFNCSMAHDPINNLIWIAYTISGDGYLSRGNLAYNISEDRASFFQLYEGGNPRCILFLRGARQGDLNSWVPGRDVRFVWSENGTSGQQFMGKVLLASPTGNSVVQKGYFQPATATTSRITRIRPIYHVSDSAAAEQITVTIESTNKPYAATPLATATYGPATDSHGWISTPTTTFADFHSVKVTMTANANMHKIVEFEGFEYDFIDGPVYSA